MDFLIGGYMNAKKIAALLLAASLAATTFTGCAINKNATVESELWWKWYCT